MIKSSLIHRNTLRASKSSDKAESACAFIAIQYLNIRQSHARPLTFACHSPSLICITTRAFNVRAFEEDSSDRQARKRRPRRQQRDTPLSSFYDPAFNDGC
jgi:hypothetical protein